MIAQALACDPALLVADEPTTALDVTVQAEVLDLMRNLRTRLNSAILLTSSFTMHWALQSIKRGERKAFLAGMVLTFLMGLAFLLTQVVERIQELRATLQALFQHLGDRQVRGILRGVEPEGVAFDYTNGDFDLNQSVFTMMSSSQPIR